MPRTIMDPSIHYIITSLYAYSKHTSLVEVFHRHSMASTVGSFLLANIVGVTFAQVMMELYGKAGYKLIYGLSNRVD